MLNALYYSPQVTDIREPIAEYREVHSTYSGFKSEIQSDTNLDTTQTNIYLNKKISALENQSLNESQASSSDTYLAFRNQGMMRHINSVIDSWIENGTHNSYAEISELKKILSEYADSLSTNSDYRIAVGAIQLLFQNNAWIEIDVKQLKHISLLLSQLNSNSGFDKRNLASFIKQVSISKIGFMHQGFSDEEIQEKISSTRQALA